MCALKTYLNEDDDSNPQDGRENWKSRKERSLRRETYQKTKGSPMESNFMKYHSADWCWSYQEDESFESEDEGDDKNTENEGEEEEAVIDPNDLNGNVNELFWHIYNEEKKQVAKFRDIVFPQLEKIGG